MFILRFILWALYPGRLVSAFSNSLPRTSADVGSTLCYELHRWISCLANPVVVTNDVFGDCIYLGAVSTRGMFFLHRFAILELGE